MRSFVTLLLSIAIVASSAPGFLGASTDEPQTLLLRVAAAQHQERVPFEGTIVAVESDEPYLRISGRTPCEVSLNTIALHGLLRSKSSSADLKVEVLRVENGSERPLSWVSGSIIVLGQSSDLGHSFVRGLPAPGDREAD